MTHAAGEIPPGLPSVSGLINVVVSRHVNDVEVLGVELNNDDWVATVAAGQQDHEEKKNGDDSSGNHGRSVSRPQDGFSVGVFSES